MKLPKSTTIVARTFQFSKYPTPSNLKNGNCLVCIYQDEIDLVGPRDSVIVAVFNPQHQQVGWRFYSSVEFFRGLVKHQKRTKSGANVKYITLGY